MSTDPGGWRPGALLAPRVERLDRHAKKLSGLPDAPQGTILHLAPPLVMSNRRGLVLMDSCIRPAACQVGSRGREHGVAGGVPTCTDEWQVVVHQHRFLRQRLFVNLRASRRYGPVPGGARLAEEAEGDSVALAFGEEVAAEAEHV